MLFSFIRYTQPAWQFNLIPSVSGTFPSCFVKSANEIYSEQVDTRYQTKTAQLADLGYRLWNKGVLLESTTSEIEHIQSSEKITLTDEYIFIRKYWGTAWCLFALMMRICTFKNPIKELYSFFKTRKIKKEKIYKDHLTYKEYDQFSSLLIGSMPKVAVIIPTLNRYQYLKDALEDLEQQSYKNFEVIVVDQSDKFNESFYAPFELQKKIIRQEEKLLWTARNKAVKATDADYILFFDDDSRVEPNWIEEHLKCLDFFKADISAGVSLAVQGQKISESYNFFRWADQFDSGNALIKRDVMHRIGMFDEQFNGQRMGDGEFGYRAYINGCRSISNPKAFRVHLKVDSGGLREMAGWDGFRPTKWFAPKPYPSVIYSFKKYFPPHLCRNAIFIGIMLSNIPYKYKRSNRMLFLSVILTIIKSPLLLIQYRRAKSIAAKMLAKKDSIVFLQE